MTPKVSVIIPVFNGESFIGRAIESCLSQSYDNVEIIVIDDGSTDGTASIVDTYVKSGAVRYVYQKNAERSAARNHGIRICNGKYIQFLDADDELLPTKICTQVSRMEGDATLAASYSATLFQENGQIIKQLFYKPKKNIVEEMILTNFIPINSLLFRKSALYAFDERIRLLEDWKFLLQVVADGRNIVGIDMPLCVVNIHSDNSSRNRMEMATAELEILSWVENQPQLAIYKNAIFFAKMMRLFELDSITWVGLVKSVWRDSRIYLRPAIVFVTKYMVRKTVQRVFFFS
jgi:glycosyltransferase involved in cell wall biosynthesis